MANEGSCRILCIREIEIVKIRSTKKSRFRLKIIAGNEKQTTEVIKIDRVGVMPKWTLGIKLDFDPQTMILWELYGRPWLSPRFKALGNVEKTLGELFEGSSTSADIHLSDGSSEVAVLKISGELNNAKNVMIDVVPNIEEPSESFKFLDSIETVQNVFDAAKNMIDVLAGAHPAATVAWGFLSIGFEVLKNQRDTKQAICDLYKDMISVYEAFSRDDILEQRDGLHGIYSSLFKQTIECAIFIEGYAKKSEIECFFAMNVSGQTEKFRQAFIDLKSQLSMGFTKESIIVTLGVQQLVIGVRELVIGVQERVDAQIMREQLQCLKSPKELGPKSTCMQGTRVETINRMMSWIAQCNGGTMWCKGLAGTGKSSLMGTLHDLLTADIGGRSRLAVFVRYDRIEYSNASKLISSIAYALGMFDDRIGMAISTVIQTSRSVVTMSDPSAQFQLLLRGPLERVTDLVDEGPLVVIIDGLDECDASNEVLAVLAEGFGPKLPFMRLIVSSRPVRVIATAFKEKHWIYPLQLDTDMEDVNRDIQFYLERQFATVGDREFQAKCKELDAIRKLTKRASGLFIWAATIVKFVSGWPGISRIEAVLSTDIPSDATEALTTLYRTALNTVVSQIESPGTNADIKKCVRNVLGAILAVRTPPGITEDVLDHIVLLGEGSPPSRHIVSMLGSVLTPEAETEDASIRLMHKSLDDFLKDQSRCGDEWFVDVTVHRKALAQQYLVASALCLKRWSSGPSMDDTFKAPVYTSQYVLSRAFWYVDAFDESGLELFASFFRCHFLPWLKVQLYRHNRALPSLSAVMNWSNQFGDTESRTLFYHAYMFAYRTLEDEAYRPSGPSYIYTRAMSLSPSSNVIRKAWEQSNASDLPASPDKERLLSCIKPGAENTFILIPESNSLTTLNRSISPLMIMQWEIDTGQQKSSSEIHHMQASFFDDDHLSHTGAGRSMIFFEYKLATAPPTSEFIMLPLHDYVSQGSIGNPSWLYLVLFDLRTRTFKTYALSLSHFSSNDFSTFEYDTGVVLVHNVGYFMKIAIGQEDNFTWTSIPAYQELHVCRDGSMIILRDHDDTIQLYDARTGAAVFDPLCTDALLKGVSDDGSKIVLLGGSSAVMRVYDMTLGGKIIAVMNHVARDVAVLFLGGSKIACILRKRLIIQSLVTGDILFSHGIPEDPTWSHYMKVTPDGTRVLTCNAIDTSMMVWDIGDL
ncbi:hypothetical protein DFS33DRAFT_1395744 [Desarmillaria ectypa]|nr:hypothetical protein DFS33DRAFT_1395744 [Desarmillaria ectypa]